MRKVGDYVIAASCAFGVWLLFNFYARILIDASLAPFQIFPDLGISLFAAVVSAAGVAFVFNLRVGWPGGAGRTWLLVCATVFTTLLAFGAFIGVYTALDETPPQRVKLEGKYPDAYSVWFSADGQTLVGQGKDFVRPVIRHWDARTGALQQSVSLASDDYLFLQDAVFSPDGQTLAVPDSLKKEVTLWDVPTGRAKLAPTPLGDDCCLDGIRIIFSPDSSAFVTASRGSGRFPVVRLWDVRTGELKSTFRGELAAFSPGGGAIAVRDSAGQTIELRDAQTFESRLVLPTERLGWAAVLVFSPDGKTLVSDGPISAADGEADLIVWDLQTGRFERKLGRRRVSNLAFSPDGRLVALNDGHMLEVYDARTWGRLRRFQPYESTRTTTGSGRRGDPLYTRVSTQPPRTTIFSPDSKTLVTTCSIGLVRLWDVGDL